LDEFINQSHVAGKTPQSIKICKIDFSQQEEHDYKTSKFSFILNKLGFIQVQYNFLLFAESLDGYYEVEE
jgi:hypothetical protein